jgi:ribosomal protein uL13
VEKSKKSKTAPVAQNVVFDGSGAIMGRLCALCAKSALKGSKVVVVNVEQAFFSGNRERLIGRYFGRRHMTQKANPEEAAKWPRRPDYFFKAVLRGMLPKHSARGKAAMSRVTAYIGVPGGVDVSKAAKVKGRDELGASAGITVLDLCRNLGWNK